MKASSTNLPLQLTKFIGREREISEVKRLLSAARLLTLTGSGGSGKTRLAIKAAEELQDDHTDGTWFVEFASLSEPSLVPQTIGSIFDIQAPENLEITNVLKHYLASKTLLLVLDNCEHLIQPIAQLAETLLRECPDLRILASSREPLNVSGETLFRVPSLAFPDPRYLPPLEIAAQYASIRLFVERAQAVKSEFQLTNANLPSVAQICSRLDGMPLAIELAAARVKVLSTQEIAARLDDRFNLLTAGSRTALPRHQTLRATIDWSYDLLSEQECVLLRRLSVFQGGWTLRAAEEICGGDGIDSQQVMGLLSHLVDKSLVLAVESRGETRYRLLETIREYAREKLEEMGEVATVQNRHLEYFVKLAEEAEPNFLGAESVTWYRRIGEELNNFRAAVEWALAGDQIAPLRLLGSLAYFWYVHAAPSEWKDRLQRALSRAEGTERTLWRAKALNAIAFFYWADIYSPEKSPELEEALSIARELGDKWNTAAALRSLGFLAGLQGNYIGARSLLGQSLVVLREMGPQGKIGIAWTDIYLGDVAMLENDEERAQSLYEDSTAILREIGDKNFVAYTVRRLGLLAWHRGDSERALALCKESLNLNLEIGDPRAVLTCLAAFAGIAVERGRALLAATLLGAVQALLKAQGAKLFLIDRIEYDRNVSALRAQLDEAALAKAWAEGSAMTMGQAIAQAQQLTSALELSPTSAPPEYPLGLTARELEVLRLLSKGMTNRQIADQLVLSKRTVDAHLSSIYGKLNVTTRSAATRAAMEQKIV